MLESSKLKPYAPFAVVLGGLGLLAAAVIWLLRREVDVAVQASLAVGLLGFALALLFNPSAVQTWLLGRQARYGGNVLLMVVALILILILGNYLVRQNPQRWDWSEDQTNTLSQESINLIQSLEQPVKAVGFYTPAASGQQNSARTLLESYRVESGDRITYEFHDPNSNIALAQAYNVVQDGTLVLELGENRQVVEFASEEQITGALSRLLNPISRVVYYVSGTGEHDFEATDEAGYSTVASQLKNQSYDLRPLNLTVTNTVPSDARALVVAGSQVPITAEAVAAIKAYVDGGGKLMVLADPAIQNQLPISTTEPLADYLRADWGIELGQNVVLANQSAYNQQLAIPVALDYGSHAITADMTGVGTVFEIARSVGVTGESTNPSVSVTPLVMAGPDAWGETQLDAASAETAPQLDPEDAQPPLNLAVAAENSATGARVVVFGDSEFAGNNWAALGGNARLFGGSLNWVAKDETLINITPKVPTTRSLAVLSSLTLNLIFLITVVAMPLAVLVIGGVVWFQRRRHV